MSQADVETADGQLAQARANLQASQIALRNAQIGVHSAMDEQDPARSLVSRAAAQVEAAEATVKHAEANMVQARLNLSYTIVHSPVDGVVLERNVDQGQTIQASYTTPQLYVIGTNLKAMQVVAALSESDISRVYRGEKATFTVDAYPDDTFDGLVTQVRNKATTTDNVVTYQVVIKVKNLDLKLRPGMTANVLGGAPARQGAASAQRRLALEAAGGPQRIVLAVFCAIDDRLGLTGRDAQEIEGLASRRDGSSEGVGAQGQQAGLG